MKIDIIRLDKVDSTNTFLRNTECMTSENMVVVTANYQSAGRGQGTNKWESDAGKNLLFSFGVCPSEFPVKRQFILSMAEALAVKNALDEYTGEITLKWPNDIYWRDMKISGTLIETSVQGNMISRCIFGTGINVNQREFRSDAPNPVSLCTILNHEVDREELLAKVINAFKYYYNKVENGDYAQIIRKYHAALYRRSGVHTFKDVHGYFDASILNVEEDGGLVLVDTQGQERKYMFKEISYVI